MDGIPVELFQILKDDVVKVLHSICQQIWNTQQWPQDWKRSVFIPIPKKVNAKEAEVEWFFEDLQDLIELTSKKNVLFIIEDWNAKVGSQETPGVTGKLGLGVQNEARQRLTSFANWS